MVAIDGANRSRPSESAGVRLKRRTARRAHPECAGRKHARTAQRLGSRASIRMSRWSTRPYRRSVTGLERRLVAVMFTDMVGYTALLQGDERSALEKRERYWSALDEQHELFGGTIVQRLGDGSMSMFPSSLAGVQAAMAIQRELTADDVHVRIGLHVGEVIVEQERLTGEAVNIAARIESFSMPGGVLLSDSAYDQIKNRSDLGVVGLGRFRLKNVGRPFELYAVAGEGLVVPERAALEGKGERFASLPNNLPEAGPPLLGRTNDLESLVALVRDERVVTITGVGGVGKTTVLAELGRRLAPEFLDGVAFVPLADVTDPAQVLPALADALDVKEAEERTLGEGIVTLIGDKQALLLLDNVEQVIAAAPDLASLVERCPALRVVITSRTPLRIAAEREFTLAPLGVPPTSEALSTDSLLTYPSVALFVERASRTIGRLELTADDAHAVAGVCRRLDGLPLALELAAARLRLLSPQALLERLDHALDVLTSGPRDSPERQQTLRATIDWSHALLTEREQRLFRRLAVFAGGFTVDDVEAVCAEPGESSLDELESLLDKALVQIDGHGGRLNMLQTIGEFAREQLASAGEADSLALRRPPLRRPRPGDPRRNRRHGPDRFRRTRDHRGGKPAGCTRHPSRRCPGRRRASSRTWDAAVRRPVDVLARPRKEHHGQGIRHQLPRNRRPSRADPRPGRRVDHHRTRLVHAR